MSIIRRVALFSMQPWRELAFVPNLVAMSPAIAVRWKGHSQYANRKKDIMKSGMKTSKLKALYTVHIFQAVQVIRMLCTPFSPCLIY